jgi:hypothetical protein
MKKPVHPNTLSHTGEVGNNVGWDNVFRDGRRAQNGRSDNKYTYPTGRDPT